MKRGNSNLATDGVDGESAPLLFDAEQIGKSLQEVAVDVIETEGSTILSRWFHSNRDVDLFIWVDGDKNVIKHQITFFGQVVEWNVFEGVKTGVVIEEEGDQRPGQSEDDEESLSETIHFDSSLDSGAVGRAMKLVEFVPDLKIQDREKICENLRLRTKGSAHSNDAFIRRYGEVYARDSRPSFWKRIKKWFSDPR